MQCTDVKTRLKQAFNADRTALSADLTGHLAHCADCRDYADDLRLQRQLDALPVPPPGEGFAERALDHAWAVKEERYMPRRPATGWWWATAASLVLVTGLVFNAPWRTTDTTDNALPMQVVQVDPQSVRHVNLLMVSGSRLPDASITVQLDGDVSLAGYPNTAQIHWQSPISAGKNQLSLPVRLSGEDGGYIVVMVESGTAHKKMRFAVRPGSTNKPITHSM